ncbi:uncharacterized protein K460DRAFT_357477 [Cucurbitaria berberidis CBS 394.84]|uniref:Uncharacterized protein n=1 Tax=Cucurbitaria berberidis CBS 394.84 TaxID=1168544 RepID=A0A9P4GEA1_9PLEO|nr:uncharacterized protein K460DRAFT_357477 [Cucurbitaria berberidis CBS 394.84]KAF1843792.1 hypothetical protein K460DRAFT_357477 [Cucurbitaria berberidis CBS 394.84]
MVEGRAWHGILARLHASLVLQFCTALPLITGSRLAQPLPYGSREPSRSSLRAQPPKRAAIVAAAVAIPHRQRKSVHGCGVARAPSPASLESTLNCHTGVRVRASSGLCPFSLHAVSVFAARNPPHAAKVLSAAAPWSHSAGQTHYSSPLRLGYASETAVAPPPIRQKAFLGPIPQSAVGAVSLAIVQANSPVARLVGAEKTNVPCHCSYTDPIAGIRIYCGSLLTNPRADGIVRRSSEGESQAVEPEAVLGPRSTKDSRQTKYTVQRHTVETPPKAVVIDIVAQSFAATLYRHSSS